MHKKLNLSTLIEIAKRNVFILLIFALLSMTSAVVLLKSNFIPGAGDFYFHFQRITEIKDSVLHGNLFQDVALTKFDQSGSAVMTMYPKLNIIPLALLSFIIKNLVHLVYIIFILRNFFALILAYFACYSYDRQKNISFIFSISYTLSTMVLNYALNLGDIGVSSSLIYLPLVLFGTLNLLHKNKWMELAIGMTGVLSSQVIASVMSVALVLVLLLLNLTKLKNRETIVSLLKSIVLTILTTGFFWIPFIFISTHNKIGMPFVVSSLGGVDFNTLVSSVFNNTVSQYITVFAFIGIVLTIINYKKINESSKQIFWIAISTILICSSFIPWNILNNTFLRSTYQFSWRILIITQVLLCYLFAENAVRLCKNKKQLVTTIVTVTFAVMCSQIVGQREIIDNYYNNPLNTDNVVSGKNYYLIFDYYPESAKTAPGLAEKFRNHQGDYGSNKQITTTPLSNGRFTFQLGENVNDFRMPFLIYNGINYKVKVDGKNVKFHSGNDSQLTLNHVNKGKHIAQVIVHKSWYDYLSYVLSVLGVVIFVFAWIRLLILKRKNVKVSIGRFFW